MYSLSYSEKIRNDIRSSYIYIRENLESPMAAENLIVELINKLNYLKENPFTRPLVHNKYLASKGIRFMNVKNYMLIYYVEEETNEVFLYRFMYSRRDWINILTNDLAEE